MTTRVQNDTLDKWNKKGSSPIWEQIQSFPLLSRIGSCFRFNISHCDSEDIMVSEEQSQLLNSLREVLGKAQVEDVDHLFGHIINGRDYFVTSDSHFLNHTEVLLEQFNVTVLTPKEIAAKLRNEPSHR